MIPNLVGKALQAFLVALIIEPNCARAVTYYDALKQFSTKSNPEGVWSYMGSELLTFSHSHYKGVKGLDGWSNGENVGRVTVLKNKTGNPVSLFHGDLVIPVDHLMLDGEDNGEGAIVQFTAPVAGTYSIKGDFLSLARNGGLHGAYILLNGQTALYAHRIAAGHDHKFKVSVALAVGDTVQFRSLASQAPGPLQTGLAAKIVGP
jgi:hypothetical protein